MTVRQAVSFLTALGGPAEPGPRAFRWFPAAGACLGLALGGAWWGAAELWPAPVAAALIVAADLAVTGLLHLDGLVDTADGLLAPFGRDRERRLEVMARPDVGAFGVAVAVVLLLLRWVALAAMAPSALLLAALWCASRTAMVVTARALPYARPGGLAQPFLGDGGWAPAAVGMAAAAALAVWWRPLAGPLALVTAMAGAAGVALLARRRIGGFTGDVLGALGVTAETAGLLVAAARW